MNSGVLENSIRSAFGENADQQNAEAAVKMADTNNTLDNLKVMFPG